ncbi:MAG TPA: hypothetical protein VMM92_00565, partial [Thermoanaerobaculia bacterium]|nr:hypothetical protein [Thermoanaerobaculia bacterium]
MELAAVLSGPHGERLAEAGLSSRRTVKVLSLVTPAAGRYHLAVSAAEGGAGAGEGGPPQGTALLTLEERRPATARDQGRVEAQRALADGLALWQSAAAGGKEKSREKLASARRLAQAAGDFAVEIDAQAEIGHIQINDGDAQGALPELRQAEAAARRHGYVHGMALAASE